MILYKGKIQEDINQSALLETLEADCLSTLQNQNTLNTIDVINACDILTKQIENGDFDEIVLPLLEQFDIPKSYFSRYVSMFNKESLLKKIHFELGDDFDNLSNLNEENRREIHPLGILFHIAAGNVDVLPAYSVIEGLLVGNINILKLPSGDKGVSIELLSKLIEIEPKLKEYIYVFDVPSTEIKTLKVFADIADAVIVWGGDTAVRAARKMANVNTKIIEWGHKLSFAYCSENATETDLRALAKHIVTTDQLLCSSAQGIYLDTSDRNKLDTFAEKFFKILVEENRKVKQVPYGIKAKNAVELYYEDMVSNRTKKKIWKKDGVSVITSNDSNLELSLLFRNVWIKMLPKETIVKTIKPHKNHLQSVAILSSKETYAMYTSLMIQSGLVRIKKPSELSDVILGESHDGMYPLRQYSRIVEIYSNKKR